MKKLVILGIAALFVTSQAHANPFPTSPEEEFPPVDEGPGDELDPGDGEEGDEEDPGENYYLLDAVAEAADLCAEKLGGSLVEATASRGKKKPQKRLDPCVNVLTKSLPILYKHLDKLELIGADELEQLQALSAKIKSLAK